MKVLFLHGLESLPGGTKVQHLESLGHDVLNPLLPRGSFDTSVTIARSIINNDCPDIIVGSSRGGAVAMCANDTSIPMVLVAPAWRHYDVPVNNHMPNTHVLHCPYDDIVSIEDSHKLAALPQVCLKEVGSCHRMSCDDSLAAIAKSVEEIMG